MRLSTADAIPGALAGADHGVNSSAEFSARRVLTHALGLQNEGVLSELLSQPSSHAPMLSQLSPSQREGLRRSLGSLAQETDARLFFSDLFHLAWSLHGENPVVAAALLQGVADPANGAPAELAHQADLKLSLLAGEGALGDRLELAAENFVTEVSRPSMVVGLTAGCLASGITRFGLLRYFRNFPASHLLRNPNWAYLGANGGAFAAEVLALQGASQGAEFLLSGHRGSASERWPEDLAMTAAMLGAVKLGGALFRGVFNVGYGLHPLRGRLVTANPWMMSSARTAQGLGQAAGLYSYYRLGPQLGLAPEGADQHAVFHTLTTGAQMWGAAALARHVTGPRFWNSLSQLETTTERMTWEWPGWHGRPLPALAYAGGAPTNLLRPDRPTDPFGQPMWMSSLKDEVPGSQGKRGPARSASRIRSVTVKSLLENPREAAESLPDLTPTRLRRVIQGYSSEGRLLQLLMEYEGLRSGEGLDVETAGERLGDLGRQFNQWMETRRAGTSSADRNQAIRNWVMQMGVGEHGNLGLEGFLVHMRNLGIRGFDNIFQMKGEIIDFDGAIRRNDDLRDYYYDLFLIREFLNTELAPKYVGEDGSFISNLIQEGDGHCVSFSLLFSHFASLMGREVQLGLLPNHVYLVTSGGGAIETTSGFALLPRSYFLQPENFGEPKARPISEGVGLYFHHMGRLSGARQNFEEARDALRVAETLAPNHPSNHFHWARYWVQEGKFSEAAQAFLRYGQASQHNPEALEKATRQLNGLLEAGHEYPEVYRALAQVLRLRGQEQQAETLETIADLF